MLDVHVHPDPAAEVAEVVEVAADGDVELIGTTPKPRQPSICNGRFMFWREELKLSLANQGRDQP